MNRQATMFVVSVIALLIFVSCGNNEISEPKTDEPINFEIITGDTASDEIVALFSVAGAQEPVTMGRSLCSKERTIDAI